MHAYIQHTYSVPYINIHSIYSYTLCICVHSQHLTLHTYIHIYLYTCDAECARWFKDASGVVESEFDSCADFVGFHCDHLMHSYADTYVCMYVYMYVLNAFQEGTSSTSWLQMRKVSVPTVFTAAPSANRPTWGRVTTLLASNDSVMP